MIFGPGFERFNKKCQQHQSWVVQSCTRLCQTVLDCTSLVPDSTRMHHSLSFCTEVNTSIHIYFCCRAQILKSGCFTQIYSNWGVSGRNIGQTPVWATLCSAAEFFGSDMDMAGCNAMFILLLVLFITKNGAKSTYCMVRGKFLISNRSCAKILIFRRHKHL